MNVVLLIVRVVAGLLFARHGAQKLFGWFGGPGIRQGGAIFDSLGLHPGRVQVTAAGASEVTAGLLLTLGFAPPVAGMLVAATMTAAFISVTSKKPWDNEWDLIALYVLVGFAFAGLGAGKISLDHAAGISFSGLGWAAGAMVLGAVGGAGAVIAGRLFPAAVVEPEAGSKAVPR
jgi:putative oxidoreductase